MTDMRTGSPPSGGGSRAAKTHAELLSRFPSLSALADAIGYPLETVHSWKRPERNNVPAEHWNAVAAAARALGVRNVSVAAFRRIAEQRAEERRALRRASRASGSIPVRIAFP